MLETKKNKGMHECADPASEQVVEGQVQLEVDAQGTREPRCLQGEHRARVALTHRRQEVTEAGPLLPARCRSCLGPRR